MNLETTLDELRAERARIDQAITVLESLNGGAPAAAKTRGGGGNGKPPKKASGSRREVASAARPTNGGTGKTRARVAEYLKSHPAATTSEIAKAVGKTAQAVAYHLKALGHG